MSRCETAPRYAGPKNLLNNGRKKRERQRLPRADFRNRVAASPLTRADEQHRVQV
jgi:hypothetical protein